MNPMQFFTFWPETWVDFLTELRSAGVVQGYIFCELIGRGLTDAHYSFGYYVPTTDECSLAEPEQKLLVFSALQTLTQDVNIPCDITIVRVRNQPTEYSLAVWRVTEDDRNRLHRGGYRESPRGKLGYACERDVRNLT
jgi:hypothetical protein